MGVILIAESHWDDDPPYESLCLERVKVVQTKETEVQVDYQGFSPRTVVLGWVCNQQIQRNVMFMVFDSQGNRGDHHFSSSVFETCFVLT